jgi:hypothetical protein
MDPSTLDCNNFSQHIPKRKIRPVALACIPCRSRKVKCDATLPSCVRCSANGKTCEYQKSRRGGRPRRPGAVPLEETVEPPPMLLDEHAARRPYETQNTRADSFSSAHASSGSDSARSSTQSIADTLESGSYMESVDPGGTHLTRMQVDQLLSQYFQFFHVSHPCVLPLRALRVHLMNEPIASTVLLPVLLFIGSVFTETVDTKPLSLAARQAIDSARLQEGAFNPFYIQAVLLYSIAMYASNELEKTRGLLDEAIHAALKLGMHRAEFASVYGQMDPVLEESWRRTWWMIYTTDAHIAGSTHIYPAQTGTVHITTGLPCEEQQYDSGVRPFKAPLRVQSADALSEHSSSSNTAQLWCARIQRHRVLFLCPIYWLHSRTEPRARNTPHRRH